MSRVASTYNALLAPAAIPPDTAQILFDAAQRVMADPAFEAFLTSVPVQAVAGVSPQAAREYMQSELLVWRPIIQATGMTMD